MFSRPKKVSSRTFFLGVMEKDGCENCALLLKRIEELEKRLLAYENAHTPPSKQRGQRHYPKPENSSGNRGAPLGHTGTTRKEPEPNEHKTLSLEHCPKCSTELGEPQRVERRIIEEIPEPKPLRIIEFSVPHYWCTNCAKEVIATDPELPKEGNLGNNLLTQIVLAKYEERLPCRKIESLLDRQYKLKLTASTILDVTRRVAQQLQPIYNRIQQEIGSSDRCNADETGSKLNGKKYWLWLFMSTTSVLFLFRKRREAKVIREVLGEDYSGILNCDGLKAYRTIVRLVQRCWAHLLREAKFLAQKHKGQAKVLYDSLIELFEEMKGKLISVEKAMEKMSLFLTIAKAYQELRKFAVLIENGLEHWFTCLKYENVEPTNNRAEQQLREFVIQRKIYPTFRSEEGMKTAEVIMSALATWKLRGLNVFAMLRQVLSS